MTGPTVTIQVINRFYDRGGVIPILSEQRLPPGVISCEDCTSPTSPFYKRQIKTPRMYNWVVSPVYLRQIITSYGVTYKIEEENIIFDVTPLSCPTTGDLLVVLVCEYEYSRYPSVYLNNVNGEPADNTFGAVLGFPYGTTKVVTREAEGFVRTVIFSPNAGFKFKDWTWAPIPAFPPFAPEPIPSNTTLSVDYTTGSLHIKNLMSPIAITPYAEPADTVKVHIYDKNNGDGGLPTDQYSEYKSKTRRLDSGKSDVDIVPNGIHVWYGYQGDPVESTTPLTLPVVGSDAQYEFDIIDLAANAAPAGARVTSIVVEMSCADPDFRVTADKSFKVVEGVPRYGKVVCVDNIQVGTISGITPFVSTNDLTTVTIPKVIDYMGASATRVDDGIRLYNFVMDGERVYTGVNIDDTVDPAIVTFRGRNFPLPIDADIKIGPLAIVAALYQTGG
jgi:hypothetical protein